jgi:hypothetical protein
VDEQIQPTPEQPAEATTEETADVAAPEAAVEETAQAPVTDWRQDLKRILDEAPAEEIRRHPKFAGIVGTEKQTWQQQYEAQKREADEAAALERMRAEMREKARSNPVAFADEWLSAEESKEQQDRLIKLETNARQEIGKQIGAAFHAIPEWGDIAADADSLARLATAIQGKTVEDVLPAWNAAAAELIADRRARALADKIVAERLAAERAAWETEAAANGFVTSARPDLVRGGRVATADPEPDFRRDPKGWNAWWERNK